MFVSSLVGLVAIDMALVGHTGEGAWGWRQSAARFAWPAALASLTEAFTSQVGRR